jgi:hypothetical protein
MTVLAEMLANAANDAWPAEPDEEARRVLASWAFQRECLLVDEAENRAWEERMRALMRLDLPYLAFVEARTQALSERLRARKLAQSSLRYKYGFKPRTRALVCRDVRRFYRVWNAA